LSILAVEVNRETITEALRVGPYGRCVYDCDNDVVDHQVVNIEYAGGVTASVTVSAFTPMSFRKTRIFGTRGMIEGDGYSVNVFDFVTSRSTSMQIVDPSDPLAGEGHLGADAALTRSFLAAVRDDDPGRILTSPQVSLHTHEIVWAAERARRHGRVELVPAEGAALLPSTGSGITRPEPVEGPAS
jgi:predicted dehydrogenase